MLPQKLFEYATKKKKEGYPDQMIKDMFVKQGWPITVIDEVYVAINQGKDAPTALTTPAMTTLVPPPTEGVEVIKEVTSEKIEAQANQVPKKWLNILTVLFILLSERYTTIASSLITVFVMMQRAFSISGGNISMFQSYPQILVLAIVAMIVGIFYFYVALRSRAFSQQSRKIALNTTLFIPLVFYPLANLLMFSTYKQLSTIDGSNTQYITPGSDLIFIIAILIILWKKRDLHTNPDTGLTKKSKIWLSIAVGVGILTFVISTIFLVQLSNSGDMQYNTVAPQVDFTIHKLSSLPANMSYATNYGVKVSDEGVKSVRISLGTEISQRTQENSDVIVIDQRKAVPGYDIKNDFVGFDPDLMTVNIPAATNQVGYLGQKPMGTKTLYSLEFMTDDGVIINLLSPANSSVKLLEAGQLLE